jgi:hypothetical protein
MAGLSHIVDLGAEVACISVASKVFRRKYDLDYALDGLAQMVRWLAVAVGFGIASIPGASLGLVRLGGGLFGLAFLCWPNCAYHLSRQSKRSDIQT